MSRWGVLWPKLEEMLSPDQPVGPVIEAGFQQALQRGDMQCWALELPGEEQLQLCGMAVTTIMGDPFMRTRNLVVYGLYTVTAIDLAAWKSLEQPLLEFARLTGCQHILAETNNVRAKQIAEALGFVSSLLLRRRVE